MVKKYKGVNLHPDVRKKLKLAASNKEMSMIEWIEMKAEEDLGLKIPSINKEECKRKKYYGFIK